MIMDAQIHTATYHYRLEENLLGDAAHVIECNAIIDRATSLIDTTLKGGHIADHRIVTPFRDPELRARTEAIKTLLIQLKNLGIERMQSANRPATAGVIYREFHSIYNESLEKMGKLNEILEREEATNQQKSRDLFRGIVVTWPLIIVILARIIMNHEKKRKNAEEFLRKSNELLSSQTEELELHREHLSELVDTRTSELIGANDLLRREISERKLTEERLLKTEQQVREVSAALLQTQETERRHLSLELHDALGQSLNVIKLKVRFLEKALLEDQSSLRDDCEELLEYLDEVVDDVRRISVALSPTILEDLGLTSAIVWLINGYAGVKNLQIAHNIEKIDHLFGESQQLTLYRVVQEALANIVRHSEARNASVCIMRGEDEVLFTIEDDGKGFDLSRVVKKKSSSRGLGQYSMKERVKMMDGTLEVWSREGEGARISFRVPIKKCEG